MNEILETTPRSKSFIQLPNWILQNKIHPLCKFHLSSTPLQAVSQNYFLLLLHYQFKLHGTVGRSWDTPQDAVEIVSLLVKVNPPLTSSAGPLFSSFAYNLLPLPSSHMSPFSLQISLYKTFPVLRTFNATRSFLNNPNGRQLIRSTTNECLFHQLKTALTFP